MASEVAVPLPCAAPAPPAPRVPQTGRPPGKQRRLPNYRRRLPPSRALRGKFRCPINDFKKALMNPNSRLFIASALALSVGCSAPKALRQPAPPISIAPRAAWGAAEPAPYRQHVPVRITVHHEGTRLDSTADAAKKIRAIQRWGMGPDRKWADIPYHFLIAPNGTVYEGRNPYTVGETATEYDPSGHLLITCLGNLEEQELPPAQLDALVRLIAHCNRTYRISPDSLATHRDHSNQTTCPGRNLYFYFQNGYVQREVKALQVKQ
ncbi:MAG: N-acetylmuramoyl-L-alanine amidase [Chitinophagaceae bacterium]|nr:MAG: N-acetylmuramoyl-L-alanine amidase [Chitinophagaceae bacterium]